MERAETTLTELNPVTVRRTDEDHLMDPDFHQGALAYPRGSAPPLRSKPTPVSARGRHGLVRGGHRCPIAPRRPRTSERRAFDPRQLSRCGRSCTVAWPIGTDRGPVGPLFALHRVEDHSGWFQEVGYIEGGKARAIRRRVDALCTDLRGEAEVLVNAFGIPEELLPSIATGQAGTPGP